MTETTIEPFAEGFVMALAPEFVLVIGLFTLILVPNMGDAKFRIPLTQIRIPWFLGGKRGTLDRDPRLPGLFASIFLTVSFLMALASFVGGMERVNITTANGTELFRVDEFSRMFEVIFYGALSLASIASIDRLPATSTADRSLSGLYNNRRQVDFYILLMTCGLGMSVVALSQDLFMLFIGLELASFSTYVLVAFMKETPEGTESGMKYFIVGSVASGVGLYGLSLLYLWSGSLQFDGPGGLSEAFRTSGMEPLPLVALGLILVGFGFKVSAAPFHFAAPDAYAGATGPVAGVLATASKAMGILGLLRILLVVASPENTEGSAVWLVALGVLAAVTMTWGNLAALGSTNPKRMLAYSSAAHAGYMLAALTAVGVWSEDTAFADDASMAVVTALIFHLVVLVCFKLGAFLVLSILESEKGGHTLESLGGLAKREPLLAVAMFIFMMSLAGVPPLSGFVSKLLVIMGIVKVAVGGALVNGGTLNFSDLHWVWYLALLMVLNSAISVFYYLRVGLVMFFHEPEEGREGRLPSGKSIRFAVLACVMTTIYFGVGADQLITVCQSAANALLNVW